MRTTHLVALTLSLGLLVLGAVAVGADAEESTKTPGVEHPDLIVARFHADWCGACKQLAPKFDALQRAAADQPVLFVTLDLTSAGSRRQAGLLAGALGLDKAWERSALKTGQALIVCGRYKEVIATVPADEDPTTSLEKLREALAMVPEH
ncbi:MAG: thioredoxin domain-containing protein [Planctomycetota bacterium]